MAMHRGSIYRDRYEQHLRGGEYDGQFCVRNVHVLERQEVSATRSRIHSYNSLGTTQVSKILTACEKGVPR